MSAYTVVPGRERIQRERTRNLDLFSAKQLGIPGSRPARAVRAPE